MNAELSDDLYLRFRDLLLTRCGLYYPERKRTDLAHGLNLVLGASGHATLTELYADAVAAGPAWDTLLAQLTIGETYFFRNGAQFDVLRDHIVPQLRERRSALRTLRLWSAGCATGEEPYSLAILLSDLLSSDDSWNVSILATDINPIFLARAREALYGSWSFRETPTDLRDRFWTEEHGRWRLHPEIRRMVTFARLNLAEPCYPAIANGTSAIDIIVCRNVTIYFDEATTRQVAERFYNALTPGGWLIVGHAEPQASVYQRFEVHNFPNTVIYRKPLDAPLFSFGPASAVGGARPKPTFTTSDQRPATGDRSRIHQGDKQTRDTRHKTYGTSPLPSLSSPTSLPSQEPATSAQRPAAGHDLWPAIAVRLAQGDKASVEPLLKELLRADPLHMQALVALGQLHADRAEWSSAQQHCMLALEQDPLCIPAHYLLAQVHEHQDQLDAALAAYRRTLYLDRGFVLGMIGMAGIWRRMGRPAEAQRYYRNALTHLKQLAPSTPIPGADGASAADLTALVMRQLEASTR
jgi:chemotaxis protein methyltransferase CheR